MWPTRRPMESTTGMATRSYFSKSMATSSSVVSVLTATGSVSITFLILDTEGVGDKLFEREGAAQAVVVVNHIHVVDLVHILGLHPELLDAFGHAPVFVDHEHFRTHQTAGGVLVVFQQVDDVAGLVNVVDM